MYIKYREMPKSLYAKYKLLYEIWELSEGTGTFALSHWAIKDKHGKAYYYKKHVKLRAIPTVLKIYRRGDDNLPDDVISFLGKNPRTNNVLRYEGSPEEMDAAVKYIEDLHKSFDFFFDEDASDK